jgi:hypothetical protein
MRKHLVLVCFGYAAFSFGVSISQFGIQAGLSFWLTTGILTACLIFFLIVIFRLKTLSMTQIKKFLTDFIEALGNGTFQGATEEEKKTIEKLKMQGERLLRQLEGGDKDPAVQRPGH